MIRHVRRLALLATLATTGCQYLQFIPFLKRQVDTRPRGERHTFRGPAFADPGGTRRPLDPAADWPVYNHDLSTGRRFSPLAQITAANVGALRVACTAPLGQRAAMESGP